MTLRSAPIALMAAALGMSLSAAHASSDDETTVDTSVQQIDRAIGLVEFSNGKSVNTNDFFAIDQDLVAGDSVRLIFDNGTLERVRALN